MNKKGQALVEFVIIIPIIMMILFIIIDFSNVFYQKNSLESTISDVVRLKENGKSDAFIKNKFDKDLKITYKQENDVLYVTVSRKINLLTPFSSAFFKNPYKISSERVLIYE